MTANTAPRFTTSSTAAEVVAGIDLTGKRAVVTGAASGIGVETARALASAGAQVTLAVRDRAAGERTAADITATTGSTAVRVAPLDLADQVSVAAFTANWDDPLHLLVNNAAVMACPLARTPEGWELQFATNHLGHFALTKGLHRHLAAAGGARVVSVSSSAHHRSPVVFDDVHCAEREYQAWDAYAQSKTANVLFGVSATTRWAADGITVNALMPGSISTNLQRHVDLEEIARARAAAGVTEVRRKSPEQGAATSVYVATAPELEGLGGKYFEDCAEAGPFVPGTNRGVVDHALDPEAADRLWEVSLRTLAG